MSAEFTKRLREERAKIWEQQKALLDTAAGEKRELSAEEEKAYDERNAKLDSIDERVRGLEESEKRTRETEEAFAHLLEQKREVGAAGDEAPEMGEVREFLRGERRSVEIKPEGRVDFRALAKGTATAGGNTVPTSFYNRLIEHMIEVSGVLTLDPTVLNTDSGENIEIPVTTSHGTAALVAEGATIPQNDPAFGKRTLGSYKYGELIKVPRELIDDTGVDLEGYLARQGGRAVGNAFGAHLAVGTGSGQPAGVITQATAGVTGGTGVGGAFTADNLIDLFYSVIAPYRNSASAGWLMRDAALGQARKLKDTTGQYLWQPSLQAGTPDTLLGKPVGTDPYVPAVGLGNKSVAFGDMSAYFVRLVNGVRFERSDDFAFDQDVVTFRVLVRGDGLTADQTGAIKAFTGGAS